MSGFSSDNLLRWLKGNSWCHTSTGDIKMAGFSADNLTSMVEKLTAGATGALGKIEMTGYDAADLSGMMER